MPRYPFTEWTADQVRLSAFQVPGSAVPNPEVWWEAVIGAPPDEITANARAGLRTVAGTFHSSKLILKTEMDRIDWLFLPQSPDPAAGPPGDFVSIGPITDALDHFSQIAERWLNRPDVPELSRIAFGAIVHHTEENHHSAYLRLPEYLPVTLPTEAADFHFQINLPRGSDTGIEGLRINRLSRWWVMALARIALSIGTTSTQVMSYALRIELDINTSPEFQGPLPRERMIWLYRELIASGRNIITEGLRR
jgi:hypothetical protein